ncbi:MAG TPA: hypothetical protein VNU01_12170 [Egibacteraceae bacterium]|nr:hypothetical protein [Egibacteraceae bacterium]
MIDDDILEPLPPDLVAVLERDLLAVDIDTFWDRKDALTRIVPERGPVNDEHRAARVRAAAALPAELFEAVVDFLDTPGAPLSTLDEVLSDWESVRVDPEKLVGHALLIHQEPPESILTMTYLDLEEYHRVLHERAAARRPPGR